MNIERNYSGAWVIYSSDNAGYLVTRSYWGYNKREAVRLFRQYMKEINKWESKNDLDKNLIKV